jgi:hypothetical protein
LEKDTHLLFAISLSKIKKKIKNIPGLKVQKTKLNPNFVIFCVKFGTIDAESFWRLFFYLK